MKTYAEATKSRVPSRANDAPAPDALAHKAQLRNSLLRAGVQPRLQIGAANDPLEREADAVAGRVLRMPEPASAPVGDGPASQMPHISRVQAKASAEPPVSPRLESSLNSLKNGGAPMDASSRAFFEPRFGRDFSGVRIHTDAPAAQMADSLRAKAFTLGNDIAFAADLYSPGATAGRSLMGHELAHVVQQQGMNVASPQAKLVQREIAVNKDDLREYNIGGKTINNRVGVNGANNPNDVKIVQMLWNRVAREDGGAEKQEDPPKDANGKVMPHNDGEYWLDVDGQIGKKTLYAIKHFQTINNDLLKINVDGGVDPDGKTLGLLNCNDQNKENANIPPTPTGTPPAISEINIPQPAPPKDGNTGNNKNPPKDNVNDITQEEWLMRVNIIGTAWGLLGAVDGGKTETDNITDKNNPDYTEETSGKPVRKGWQMLKEIYEVAIKGQPYKNNPNWWKGNNKMHLKEVKSINANERVTDLRQETDKTGNVTTVRKPIYWCGIFTAYVLRNANVGLDDVGWELGDGGLKNKLTWNTKDIPNCKPGDILAIRSDNNHHCILIKKEDDGVITTVDGNSTNQGICRNSRKLSDVVGYYDVSTAK